MKFVFIGLVFLLLIFPSQVSAQENQFITIVNPVRISPNTDNPKASLETEYQEILKRNLTATWLLTYDAINNEGVLSVVKQMDQKQEFGIFMEVSLKLANSIEVNYKKDSSWHDSNVVFLSGYAQSDRIKLIDRVFENFKSTFGYYPTSVGAWWIDSFSLNYMKSKFGITAYLNVADQYSTDNYQVWGQYWSTPFYPSKLHAGVPASSLDSKLNIVTIQWAPRDPLNGYGQSRASLYSTQDYPLVGLNDEYLRQLINLYGKRHLNSFGQITLGLEGDLVPEIYKTIYARWLSIAKEFEESGEIKVLTMSRFSDWYRQSFKDLSPAQIIETDDLLDKRKKVIWYQSPKYRIGIVHNYNLNETKIVDLRVYFDNFEEPYNISPNRQIKLNINIPSIIDEASSPNNSWKIYNERILSTESNNQKFKIDFGNEFLELDPEYIQIPQKVKIPQIVKSSYAFKIERDTIIPQSKYLVPPPGIVTYDLTIESTYFMQQKKIRLMMAGGFISFILVIFLIHRFKMSELSKFGILILLISIIVGGIYHWVNANSQKYFASQAEVDALSKLSAMPMGKIVVYNRDCLQCHWHSAYKPAVFANKRDYVKKITQKPIIYNSSIFKAETREEGRRELKKLNAIYIYLVKYEDYLEIMPFSPGDYNLEMVYENANAQIWRIK